MSDEVPALAFENTPYHPNDVGNMALELHERGFTVARGLFEPSSTMAYRGQLEQSIDRTPPGEHLQPRPDELLSVWPAKAPRLRQVLRRCFAWARWEPHVVLISPAWLVQARNTEAHGWHKDWDHEGLGTAGGRFQLPTMLQVSIPFEALGHAQGATQIIPRSHRNATLSPYADAKPVTMVCGAADAVIWDPRLWHRGSSRTANGRRIVAIFTFCPVYGKPAQTPACKAAFAAAETSSEQILFGGIPQAAPKVV